MAQMGQQPGGHPAPPGGGETKGEPGQGETGKPNGTGKSNGSLPVSKPSVHLKGGA
jgi:hypothetical protein